MAGQQSRFSLRHCKRPKGGKWTILEPSTPLQVHEPKGTGDHWFDYNQNWYTLMVHDEEGNELPSGTNESVTLSLTFVADSGVDVNPVAITAKAAKGVFWFKSLDPYLFGRLTMTFSMTSTVRQGVVPLVVEIPVTKDIYGKSYASSALVKRDDFELNDDASSPAPKSSSSRKRANSATEGGEGGDGKKKRLKQPVFVSTCDDILHMPSALPFLSSRNRIERFVKEGATAMAATDGGKRGSWKIDGPVLKVELSSALTTVMLDDKSQIEALSAMSNSGLDIRILDQTRSSVHRPTVNELFFKLQNKMSQVPEADKSIQHLRICFEATFENNILFQEERQLFKSKLDSCRSSHSKFGDNFGSYYFLRFLIFFVMAADTASYDESASSSAQRRNTISSRQGKTVFARLQEIVDLALRDLDDGAHYYFS